MLCVSTTRHEWVHVRCVVLRPAGPSISVYNHSSLYAVYAPTVLSCSKPFFGHLLLSQHRTCTLGQHRKQERITAICENNAIIRKIIGQIVCSPTQRIPMLLQKFPLFLFWATQPQGWSCCSSFWGELRAIHCLPGRRYDTFH